MLLLALACVFSVPHDVDPTAETAVPTEVCAGSDPLLLESNSDLVLNPEEPELAFSFEGPGEICSVSCSMEGVALEADDGSLPPWSLFSDQILNLEVFVDTTAIAGEGLCEARLPSGLVVVLYEVSILR